MEKSCSQCGASLMVYGDKVDTNVKVSPVLYVEGILNDISHHVNGMRKRAGFNIDDRIIICSPAAKYLNFYHIKKNILASIIIEDLHNGCAIVEEVPGTGVVVGIAKYEEPKQNAIGNVGKIFSVV